MDDRKSRKFRDSDKLLDYIDEKIVNDGKPYYAILDEVQLVDDFVEVLLSLTHIENVDVYVSDSNSRFLSSDVVTEFRGRGDEIRVRPLSFSEYYGGVPVIYGRHGWIIILMEDFLRWHYCKLHLKNLRNLFYYLY